MKEETFYERQAWLSDKGYTEADVMSDEEGEYILIDGDEEYGKVKKLLLPTNLQN